MRGLVLVCVLCVQLRCYLGLPSSQGVGTYSYQDSSGRRYGGTYKSQDGKVVATEGDPPPAFVSSFQDADDFFPDYFRNFENLLQEMAQTFNSDAFGRRPFRRPPFPFLKMIGISLRRPRAFHNQIETQNLALDPARKAFDLTSNQVGYIPDFPFRFNHFGFPGFPGSGFGQSGLGMSNFPFGPGGMPNMPAIPNMPSIPNMPGIPNMAGLGSNSAFAGAAAGPGFSQQQIAINPTNPNQPNIDVIDFSDSAPGKPGYYSVSSSSYSSSQNINGKPTNVRGGETIVNNNGKVTAYKLNN